MATKPKPPKIEDAAGPPAVPPTPPPTPVADPAITMEEKHKPTGGHWIAIQRLGMIIVVVVIIDLAKAIVWPHNESPPPTKTSSAVAGVETSRGGAWLDCGDEGDRIFVPNPTQPKTNRARDTEPPAEVMNSLTPGDYLILVRHKEGTGKPTRFLVEKDWIVEEASPIHEADRSSVDMTVTDNEVVAKAKKSDVWIRVRTKPK